MKTRQTWIPVLASFAAIAAYQGTALANEDVLARTRDAAQWSLQTGDYASTRYSALEQITSENVRQLRVAWSFSTGILRGHEGGPLVIDGIMYVHTPFPNVIYALDLDGDGFRPPVNDKHDRATRCG